MKLELKPKPLSKSYSISIRPEIDVLLQEIMDSFEMQNRSEMLSQMVRWVHEARFNGEDDNGAQ